ncbi:FAD linked oxidase [Pleurostoma richardsiae]|uniref:FAD linked oxidase n=1 Tax=Pleurostoma richardsiae TaxID=41990 RepID=A0AA38RT19_9PEZI|nr:FAD linked oxidase [Pleurostoma richardsiae]
MGVIKKVFYTGVLTGTAFVGYLGGTTTILCPLPRNDPIWTSAMYQKYNIHRNPTTQDVCIKRIPLDKIKPELLQKDGDLAVEFCRGVWSGWGYAIQRIYLARKYRAQTPKSLWTPAQLSGSTYDVGTQITDHFEVVEKTPSAITVRCGDSPRHQGPREGDGLFVMYAEVDRERNEVELGLKSCFFTSASKVEGIVGPMPVWMEKLHTWYSRIMMASGAQRLTR